MWPNGNRVYSSCAGGRERVKENQEEGMKQKIVVNYKSDKDEVLDGINAEMERVTSFGDLNRNGVVLQLMGPFANPEYFIRLGGVQKAVNGTAYFQQGHDDVAGLSICLDEGKTWEDVLTILKSIESIEV